MCDTLSDNADWSVNWYGGQYSFNMTRARRAYRSHNANFLMNCPDDKRLVLEDMDCGWQVICDFVKRPVPEVEYPHKNKTGTGGQINQLMMGRTEKIY